MWTSKDTYKINQSAQSLDLYTYLYISRDYSLYADLIYLLELPVRHTRKQYIHTLGWDLLG